MKCYRCEKEISYKSGVCAYCGTPEPLLNHLKETLLKYAKAYFRYGTVAGIICLAGIAMVWRNSTDVSDEELFYGCVDALGEIRVLQEQHFINKHAYASNLTSLIKYKTQWMAWSCDGLDASECAEKTEKQFYAYCRRDDVQNIVNSSGDTYELRVHARDPSRCAICLTPSGLTPERYGSCSTDMAFTCQK